MSAKDYLAFIGIVLGFIVCATAAIAALFGVDGDTCSGSFFGGMFLTVMTWLGRCYS